MGKRKDELIELMARQTKILKDARGHTQADWESFIQKLFTQYKLHNWIFSWNHGKKRIGICHCHQSKISISIHLLTLPPRLHYIIKDTLLHELAHALNYANHIELGHGPRWKNICKGLGARPQRTYNEQLSFALPHPERPNKPRYALYLEGQEEPVRYYLKKPNFKHSMKHYSLRGKPETLGKLTLKALDFLE